MLIHKMLTLKMLILLYEDAESNPFRTEGISGLLHSCAGTALCNAPSDFIGKLQQLEYIKSGLYPGCILQGHYIHMLLHNHCCK